MNRVYSSLVLLPCFVRDEVICVDPTLTEWELDIVLRSEFHKNEIPEANLRVPPYFESFNSFPHGICGGVFYNPDNFLQT